MNFLSSCYVHNNRHRNGLDPDSELKLRTLTFSYLEDSGYLKKKSSGRPTSPSGETVIPGHPL